MHAFKTYIYPPVNSLLGVSDTPAPGLITVAEYMNIYGLQHNHTSTKDE